MCLATVARSNVQYIDIRGLINSLDPVVHCVRWNPPNLPSMALMMDEHTHNGCLHFYLPHAHAYASMYSCPSFVKQRELQDSLSLAQLQLRCREIDREKCHETCSLQNQGTP